MTDTAALHAKSGLEAPEFASRRTLVLRRFLRSPSAVTTYRRSTDPDRSMRAITPDQVFVALEPILSAANKRL